MESKNTYDVLVIGVGMAGVSVTQKAARSGKRVAVVDSRPYGGTCALRGCDPKKVLVGAAELIDSSRRMSGSGVEGELSIDWPALMKHKESIIRDTPGALEHSMSKLGVETLHGAGRVHRRTKAHPRGGSRGDDRRRQYPQWQSKAPRLSGNPKGSFYRSLFGPGGSAGRRSAGRRLRC